jgi:hypothetical protein
VTFGEAVAQVDAARSAQELFGGDEAGHRYRAMAKLLHPDTAPAGQARVAREAFARLALLWEQYRRAEYKLYEGDIAHLYGAGGGAQLRKMPRRARDNDLMRREADALSTLEHRGEPRHRAYAPLLLDSFAQRDPATGVQRVVNVLQHLEGFVSLAQVALRYPRGVPAVDAAWMWRRLLVAVGYAHRAGVVHGAVVPEHVLIHPGEHGLALVDWCYSTRGGEPVPAMVGGRAQLYAPEVAQRRVAGPGTDIYMATKCLTWLIGEGVPDALRRFAKGCTVAHTGARPDDAWLLLGELDEVLHHLYGKRTFRPFTL